MPSLLEFAATREAFASLYDETPVATLLCDVHEARIVSANAAAQALLSYGSGELAGVTWQTLVTDAGALCDALRAAGSGARTTMEIDVRTRDSGSAHVRCEVFPARIGEHVAGAFVQLHGETQRLTDALTGLPGPAVLDDRIEQAMMTARRYSYRFAVIEGDIDGFSSITARYGASAGDWVVRVVAQRVREALRRSDTVVRIGTDRFVVLQPLVENVDDAVDVAHKIVFAMHAPIAIDGHSLDVRLSLGIAVFPLDGEDRADLLGAAGAAVREAKNHARGLFRLATKSAMETTT